MAFITPHNLIEKDENDLFECGRVLADAFQNYPLFYELLGRDKYSIKDASKVFMTVIASAGENTHTYIHRSGKGVCSFAELNVSSTNIFRIVKSLKWSLEVLMENGKYLLLQWQENRRMRAKLIFVVRSPVTSFSLFNTRS